MGSHHPSSRQRYRMCRPSPSAGLGKCEDLNRSVGPQVKAATAYPTGASVPQILLRERADSRVKCLSTYINSPF